MNANTRFTAKLVTTEIERQYLYLLNYKDPSARKCTQQDVPTQRVRSAGHKAHLLHDQTPDWIFTRLVSCRSTSLGDYLIDGMCSRDHLPSGLSCCGNIPFNPETSTCCKVHNGNSVTGKPSKSSHQHSNQCSLVPDSRVPGKSKWCANQSKYVTVLLIRVHSNNFLYSLSCSWFTVNCHLRISGSRLRLGKKMRRKLGISKVSFCYCHSRINSGFSPVLSCNCIFDVHLFIHLTNLGNFIAIFILYFLPNKYPPKQQQQQQKSFAQHRFR